MAAVFGLVSGPRIGDLVSTKMGNALSVASGTATAQDGTAAAGGDELAGGAPAPAAAPPDGGEVAAGGAGVAGGGGLVAGGAPAPDTVAAPGGTPVTEAAATGAAADVASLGDSLGGLTSEAILGAVKLDPSFAARAVGAITEAVNGAPLQTAPVTAMTQADQGTSEMLNRVVTQVLSDPAVLAGLTPSGGNPGTPGEATPAITAALSQVLADPDLLAGPPAPTGSTTQPGAPVQALTQADPELTALLTEATSAALDDSDLLLALSTSQWEPALAASIDRVLQEDPAMAAGLSQELPATLAVADDGTALQEFVAASAWGRPAGETLIASADPGVVSDSGGYLPAPAVSNPTAFLDNPWFEERVGTTLASTGLPGTVSTDASDLGGTLDGPTQNPFAGITGSTTQPGTVTLPPDAGGMDATAPVTVGFPGDNTTSLIDGYLDGGTLPPELMDGGEVLRGDGGAAILGPDGEPLRLTVSDDGTLVIPQVTLSGEQGSFFGSATLDPNGLVSATVGGGTTIDGGDLADVAGTITVDGGLTPTQVTLDSPSLGLSTELGLTGGAVTSGNATVNGVFGTDLNLGYQATVEDGTIRSGTVTAVYELGGDSAVTGSWQQLPYRDTFTVGGAGEVAPGVTVGGQFGLTTPRGLPDGVDPTVVGAGVTGSGSVAFPVGDSTVELGAQGSTSGSFGVRGGVTTPIGAALGDSIGPLDLSLSVEQEDGETFGMVTIRSSPAAPAPAPATPAVIAPVPEAITPPVEVAPARVSESVIRPSDFIGTAGLDLRSSPLDFSAAEVASFATTDFVLDSFDFGDTSFSGVSDFGGFDFGGF